MHSNNYDHPAFDTEVNIQPEALPKPATRAPLSAAMGSLFKRLDPRTAGYGAGIARIVIYYLTTWALLSLIHPFSHGAAALTLNLAVFLPAALLGCILALNISNDRLRAVYGHLHMAGLVSVLFCLITPWATPFLYTATGPAALGYGAGSAVAVLLLAITTHPSVPQGKTT